MHFKTHHRRQSYVPKSWLALIAQRTKPNKTKPEIEPIVLSSFRACLQHTQLHSRLVETVHQHLSQT